MEHAIRDGDMILVQKVGNNCGETRASEYRSGLYIKGQFPERTFSNTKTILSCNGVALKRFLTCGFGEGARNRAVFACGVFLKFREGGGVCLGAVIGGRKKKEWPLRKGVHEDFEECYEEQVYFSAISS